MAVLHVTASLADSQFNYFNNPRNGACSNFHVALDGNVEQYIDTDRLSAAEVEGSNDAISIETAGLGSGKWTDAQVISLIALLAWISATHGIPLSAKQTSRPDEAGIGWHRLGIVGTFPLEPAILRGRNQRPLEGTEAWSTHRGKVCPGNDRILQIPDLIGAARGFALPPAVPIAQPVFPTQPPVTIAPPTARPDDLLLDGWFGSKTARALQARLGSVVDGVISSQRASTPARTKYLTAFEWVAKPEGSKALALVQERLGVGTDGILGPITTRAWQERLGVKEDGVFGPRTTSALQGALNEGRIW
jgi:peptidoglycan hydrolase-like protein with peptidoglycan-binding domain